MTTHPALSPDGVAVVTGAASGIGLAAAQRFARLGMKVCLADLGGDPLERAAESVALEAPDGAAAVRAVPTDVSVLADVERLRDVAYAALGDVTVLMNNAATAGAGRPWENPERWRRLLDVNLFGPIHGVQAFVPRMLASGRDGLIVNTGSKQGITTPPGDPAYNVSKAGVKVLTEQLAFELRNVPGCKLAAHLLIPGFTHTGMTSRGGAKPDAAWTPEQVVDFLLASIARGDFYVLCPDNSVTRDMDERRMQWAIDDVILNRPALSRWHPDFAAAFEAFLRAPRAPRA
ncbi:SDR family NAD(P)-dependent oxidoreductase [Candidatus Binatia bacterium]|jgi:NAD(P)-dependent dehydrogenase (short-subunit alcohol dehydrogenase family)|nr:SDR family NAD(P)-dependent oxidoreductase [Candidatus Binatia bacterium]